MPSEGTLKQRKNSFGRPLVLPSVVLVVTDPLVLDEAVEASSDVKSITPPSWHIAHLYTAAQGGCYSVFARVVIEELTQTLSTS